MEENFWSKINRIFDRIHLQDTEIGKNGEKVYINPVVKFAVAWGIFIVLVILFLLIGKPFSKKDSNSGANPSAEGGIAQENEIISNAEYVPFEHNEHQDVNAYVESYLNAVTSCNINLLSAMVVEPSQFNIDELSLSQQYITAYSNVDCYTKPGLSEGSYVVYAVVNTQIAGVSIQPLSLFQFYLIPNENGGFINDNTARTKPDVEAYMNQIDRDPDVVELFTRVDQNNEESAKNDEALKSFYEKINVSVE